MKNLLKNLYIRLKWRGRLQMPLSARPSIHVRFEGANALSKRTRFHGSLGYGSYIGPDSDLSADVGRFTSIGPGVKSSPYLHPMRAPYATTSPMFFSLLRQNGHTFATRQMAEESRMTDPQRDIHVSIGSDCWIGEDALLIGGITIGDGAVVMARAVVTKDVEPYSVVGGVPARVVSRRYDDETVEWLTRTQWWTRPVGWLRQNWETLCDITRLRRILPAIAVICVLCMGSCSKDGSTGADATFTGLVQITDTIYSPAYASGFLITSTPDSTARIILTRQPWQGATGQGTRLLLLPDGMSSPQDFDGQVLVGDPKRVVCMSSTHVAMLDAMGATDRIVGVAGLQYISTPSIIERSTPPADVGYEGAVDYETLIGTRPDLVLLSAVNGPSSMEAKLRELKIPFMYVGDYMEESPLGKTEWIVPLGEALGLRAKARGVLSPIAERYNRLRIPADRAPRPKVLLNAPYGDAWMLPADDSYAVRLLRDAGAEPVWDNPDGQARPVDMERARLMAEEADYWLNPGMWADKNALRSHVPRVSKSHVMTAGQVWNNDALANPSGGNPYFEEGVMEPDVILADLIRILHPELSYSHTLKYYRQLK